MSADVEAAIRLLCERFNVSAEELQDWLDRKSKRKKRGRKSTVTAGLDALEAAGRVIMSRYGDNPGPLIRLDEIVAELSEPLYEAAIARAKRDPSNKGIRVWDEQRVAGIKAGVRDVVRKKIQRTRLWTIFQ